MTDIEIMDKYLNYLNEIYPAQALIYKFVSKESTEKNGESLGYRLQRQMESEGLIEETGNGFWITPVGMEVVNSGGYKTKVARILEQLEHEEENKRKEDKKLDYDLKNSRWDYRIRWITLGIAITSLAVSILAIIIALIH